ncbi:MAG TPA: nitrate/nitrite transporter [Candidatus Binatia bacterium]|jgi:NNP family nitrate/nitrite transporter-like MFS transporter
MRRGDIKKFFQAGHFGTLISAFLYFDVSFMVWVMVGALGVYIAEDFSLTAAEKGLLVAAPILGGSLLRLPLGLAADFFGPKKSGSVGLALTLIPLLWAWLGGGSVEQMLFIGLMLGIAGASFAVALPMASRCYPARYQGLVMGIAGAGNSGTVIAALLAPRLAERLGWHAVFGVATLPVLLTLAIFCLAAKEQTTRQPLQRFSAYLAVLKEADTWWFSLFYMVTFGGFVGLASFLPVFFHDQYGVSKVASGGLTALCVCAGSFFRPLGGLLADRLGGIRVLMALYALVAGVVLLLSRLPPLSWATTLLFAGMGVLGMGNGAVFQIVPQRFKNEIGVVTGLVGAAGGLGGFLLPFLLGLSKEFTGSYAAGFVFLAAATLFCLALLAYVQRDWRRDWAQEKVGVAF